MRPMRLIKQRIWKYEPPELKKILNQLLRQISKKNDRAAAYDEGLALGKTRRAIDTGFRAR